MTKLYAGESYVTLNGQQRKAQANLVVTVSKTRVSTKLDVLSQAELAVVESALKVQLGL